MKTIRSAFVAFTLAVVAVAHHSVAGLTTPVVAASQLAQLQGMSELKSWFNAHKGRPRLILLLSPT